MRRTASVFVYFTNTLRQGHCVPFPTEHVTVHRDEFIVKTITAPGRLANHLFPCLAKGIGSCSTEIR